jgi:hypothetical protein
MSMPAAASRKAITEFEFHMSPVPNTSRPHVAGGTFGIRSTIARPRDASPTRSMSTA